MNTRRKQSMVFLAGSVVGVAGALLMTQGVVSSANADGLSSEGLLLPAKAAQILAETQRMVVLSPSRMRGDGEAKQTILPPGDVVVIVDRATGCQYLVVSSAEFPPHSGRTPNPISLGLRWDASGKPMCGDRATMEKRG